MRVEARPRGALADLATRQYGIVSVAQLTGPLGYSAAAVDRAAAAGRLHRIHRGVYAVGHLDLSLHGKCLAAVLACGEGAVLSHQSAAWLWGLARWSPIPLHVTGPIRRRHRGEVNVHHSRGLMQEVCDVTERIPVTSVPRTVLDLAVRLRPEQLQRMLERAEELELFDLRHFEALLRRTVGHHGNGRLHRALELYRPPPFSRSHLERHFLRLVIDAGLPQPRMGFVVAGYELDVYWPDERFAVELDTYETHGSRQAFERDRVRDETLMLEGVEMIRVTGHRLKCEPEQVIQRLTRLLAQRRLRPGGVVEVVPA